MRRSAGTDGAGSRHFHREGQSSAWKRGDSGMRKSPSHLVHEALDPLASGSTDAPARQEVGHQHAYNTPTTHASQTHGRRRD
eukprot:7317677-Prymnesium_polylepis.5